MEIANSFPHDVIPAAVSAVTNTATETPIIIVVIVFLSLGLLFLYVVIAPQPGSDLVSPYKLLHPTRATTTEPPKTT
jgi:hypothetical protein